VNISDKTLIAGNQQERVPKDSESLHYYLTGFVDGETILESLEQSSETIR